MKTTINDQQEVISSLQSENEMIRTTSADQMSRFENVIKRF
jgi:hypothetical protein